MSVSSQIMKKIMMRASEILLQCNEISLQHHEITLKKSNIFVDNVVVTDRYN